MRVLKFRGWDINNNVMSIFDNICVSKEDGLLIFYGSYVILGDEFNYETDFSKRFIVMQYTGLQDNNGKEIYEGDILSVVINYPSGVKKYIASVEDDEIQPSFILKNATDGQAEYDWSKCDMMNYEVIGNIYENPELLEIKYG